MTKEEKLNKPKVDKVALKQSVKDKTKALKGNKTVLK